MNTHHGRVAGAMIAIAAAYALAASAAQGPQAADDPQRFDDRIRALQKESEDLARQSKTLLGELRQLELERDRRREDARRAEAEALKAQQALEAAEMRLAELETRRDAQLPDLEAQLVDLYKRGPGRYIEMLLNARSARDFARAMRVVSALAGIQERRLAEHRQTVEALRAEQAVLERAVAAQREREDEARAARAAAERAVQARAALLARVDSQRDLTAQFIGELQAVRERLDLAASGARTGAAGTPIAPLRGSLPWPVDGSVTGGFGRDTGRLGGTVAQNGIEIAAAEDGPVRAVHRGTVGYADVFTGLGNLVILDHGDRNYSLYGYLGRIVVQKGAEVAAGTELGRVGPSPAGPPALYFELRVDGRSVDPLQWLEQR